MAPGPAAARRASGALLLGLISVGLSRRFARRLALGLVDRPVVEAEVVSTAHPPSPQAI